jgi:hypothetical protein
MVVVDGKGVLLGDYLHSASPAEVKLVEKTLASIRVRRRHRPGRPRLRKHSKIPTRRRKISRKRQRPDPREQLVKHARYYWLFLAESHLIGGCLEACCQGLRRSHQQQDRRTVDRNRFRC